MGDAPERAKAAASGMSAAFKAHKKRAKIAWNEREKWNAVLFDAYDFIAPYRKSERREQRAEGSRFTRMFDPTAMVALLKFAGKLQQELLPPGQPFFLLEPGPLVEMLGFDKEEFARELETTTALIHPVFLTGEWDNAVHEMLIDVGISTGFMMILKGDMAQPVRFVTASMDEVAIDQGAYGRVEGIFFRRKWSYRAIMDQFPRGTYSAAFKTALKEDPEKEVMLCQDTVFEKAAANSNRAPWCLKVYIENSSDDVIFEEYSHECPWLTPRYFRMPGQVNGLGPALMALPTAKTLNKAMELSLKTAALAMLGIYTRVDDGVFNPDTARQEPGAIWTVGRNGGPLGPSLARLDPPGNPQLTNLVLQDLRMQIKSILMDEALPPDNQSPRSAAEVIERIKQLAQDHAGAFGRLIHEIILPVVPRVMEILHDLGILKNKYRIDQLLVGMKITSPLAAAFKAQKVKTSVDYISIVMQLGGPQAVQKLMPLLKILARIGNDMGVPPSEIYTPDESKQIEESAQELAQMMVQAMTEAQGGGAPPPPPNGDPSQATGA